MILRKNSARLAEEEFLLARQHNALSPSFLTSHQKVTPAHQHTTQTSPPDFSLSLCITHRRPAFAQLSRSCSLSPSSSSSLVHRIPPRPPRCRSLHHCLPLTITMADETLPILACRVAELLEAVFNLPRADSNLEFRETMLKHNATFWTNIVSEMALPELARSLNYERPPVHSFTHIVKPTLKVP